MRPIAQLLLFIGQSQRERHRESSFRFGAAVRIIGQATHLAVRSLRCRHAPIFYYHNGHTP
jgi:chromosome condensin MukBEF MukE localization factor